jgi:DNA-binding transcriptional MerR regulator
MSIPIESAALDRDEWCYRMKDLCEATGLPRQAIHFYIQQGLLPPGQKTGRNMAWYSDEHLERLRLIKKLQHEQFLPLKAIKALFDGEDGVFSPRQHAFLAGVKEHVAESLKTSDDRSPTLTPDEISERTGIPAADVQQAFELGLVGGARVDGTLRIADADAWIFEVFGQVRALGFTPELGFRVEDMALYQDAITKLLNEEVRLVFDRLSELPPEKVAIMIEAVVPILDHYIMRLHSTKIREFFANVL